MRVAVYDRFWRSMGGGERYTGFLAQCLSCSHEVDLITHESLDKRMLEEQLDLNLSDVGVKSVPDEDPVLFAYMTSKYDLLVNGTFGSDAMCHASRGLYVCYFPVPYAPMRTGMSAFGDRISSLKRQTPPSFIEWGDGWFSHEQGRHVYRWSTECPTLKVWTAKGTLTPVRLLFLRALPKGAEPTEAEISIDGELVRKLRIEPGRGIVPVDVPIRGRGLEPTLLEINCNTFKPYEQFGSSDPRHLGVALVADLSGRPANGYSYSRRYYRGSVELHFLESYDEVVSISQYTQRWMERLWKRQSTVLHPPVSLHSPGPKAPMILSVGRFFDNRDGHSKKQVEMVMAFRTLVDRGLSGWTYHLVGGCEPKHRSYLEQVRALAKGLPVEIHVGTTGAELKRLYSQASLFWHATGLGENDKLAPERLEHFGITTVEAMSAGAVPIVIGKGGQLEVLTDGVHGRHFTNTKELVEITWEIARNHDLRNRMSLAAQEHAQKFGPEIFRKKLADIVEEIVDR